MVLRMGHQRCVQHGGDQGEGEEELGEKGCGGSGDRKRDNFRRTGATKAICIPRVSLCDSSSAGASLAVESMN